MFKKVILYTNRLDEMKGFYEYQLGFRIVEENEESFALSIGSSVLEFRASERASFYHYAINIPGNQFSLAKFWARARVELNRQEGMDEIYYANFNSDAFYFEDPAGNVVEFIGRRHVDIMDDFTIDSLLDISEVGITTSYVKEVGERLEAMEIPVRGNKGIEPETLNFLGKDPHFFVLVPPKRVWYFSKRKSETHPLAIELIDGRVVEIDEEGHMVQKQADNPVSDLMESSAFSGTAQMAGDENWSLAKGFANRVDERPIAVDSRFAMASGSKIFTAVAVLQLVEQGKLELSASLSALLPKTFPNFHATVHQLLCHTSGLPDYFDEEAQDDFEQLWQDIPMYRMQTPADFVPLFRELPPVEEPGARFRYNNAGYIALGLVIEQVTGEEFADYVEREVLAKAGMSESGYFRLDRLPKNTAYGYIDEGDSWRTNQYSIPIRGGADGGAFVTTGDMAKFWNRLMDDTLLSGEMKTLLLTVQAQQGETAYGYGVWIDQQEEEIVKYHVMGYDPGVNIHSGYYPKHKSIVTVLSNAAEGAYDIVKVIEREKKLRG
ncbi:serine hydrolase [Planococcus maritimus]|uniref:serine hydrolase n=1 Tax=Planococcus maritimus TaxID=192421 RepID=UPI00232C78FA|nr:serine hydrolase [Planococcus maritimus]